MGKTTVNHWTPMGIFLPPLIVVCMDAKPQSRSIADPKQSQIENVQGAVLDDGYIEKM